MIVWKVDWCSASSGIAKRNPPIADNKEVGYAFG